MENTIKVTRVDGVFDILLLKHKTHNGYSFVNLTKGHICPCVFKSEEEALANLLDIIEFKKEHKDNVVLLLGNHDCSYRYNTSLCNCRYAKRLAADFRRAFNDNKELLECKPVYGKFCRAVISWFFFPKS
mgnify:CR=1 FL=1